MSDTRDWVRILPELLGQVIQREVRGSQPGEILAAAGRTRDQAVAHLEVLVGQSGARALRQRSLTLAKRQHPWLTDVISHAGEPNLAGSFEAIRKQSTAEVWAAASSLLLTFVDLVASLIGERITLQQLCEVWPDISPLLRKPKESP